MKLRYGLGLTLGLLICTLALAAWLAPYLYPEYQRHILGKDPPLLAAPTGEVAGHWFDDYFVVEEIDPTTFAIGEPRYYQGNYSYLILGEHEAVLFDAGSGTRDITPVVRALTRLPVTVVPSHLHFDHVGALGRFERTALLDTPALRARARDSRLRLGRYEFLGFLEDLPAPSFRVDLWWADGQSVELGHRSLLVLATPGHTPTSLSLYDRARAQLFAGDFIYPGPLYVFYPGASRGAYEQTTHRLLALLDPATRIFTAHMAEPPAPVRAPVLRPDDLRALEGTLLALQRGSPLPRAGAGAVLGYPRIYPVRGPITLATGYPWNNR
jgi:glyoxylase-like metal-dependent hydrolase (beta-lactamase superfamily II)